MAISILNLPLVRPPKFGAGDLALIPSAYCVLLIFPNNIILSSPQPRQPGYLWIWMEHLLALVWH